MKQDLADRRWLGDVGDPAQSGAALGAGGDVDVALAFGEAALEGRQMRLDEGVEDAVFRAMTRVTQGAWSG